MFMKTIPITTLRQNIYSVFDQIIKTGSVQEVERDGYTFQITLKKKVDKLARLKPRKGIVGDLDDLVTMKLDTWTEPNNV